MKRVLFVTENGENVFILTKLKNLVIPKIGETVKWSYILMEVKKVEHDYDSETITIAVKTI